MLNVALERLPELNSAERVIIHCFDEKVCRVSARYGFMEWPNVPEVLRVCNEPGVKIGPKTSSPADSR